MRARSPPRAQRPPAPRGCHPLAAPLRGAAASRHRPRPPAPPPPRTSRPRSVAELEAALLRTSPAHLRAAPSAAPQHAPPETPLAPAARRMPHGVSAAAASLREQRGCRGCCAASSTPHEACAPQAYARTMPPASHACSDQAAAAREGSTGGGASASRARPSLADSHHRPRSLTAARCAHAHEHGRLPAPPAAEPQRRSALTPGIAAQRDEAGWLRACDAAAAGLNAAERSHGAAAGGAVALCAEVYSYGRAAEAGGYGGAAGKPALEPRLAAWAEAACGPSLRRAPADGLAPPWPPPGGAAANHGALGDCGDRADPAGCGACGGCGLLGACGGLSLSAYVESVVAANCRMRERLASAQAELRE